MSVAQIQDIGNGLQYFRIAPSNNPANGIFSHQSNPVLSFELPSSNVILNMKTLRIVGKLRCRDGTLTDAQVANTRIDQYLGVNSCFANVSWSSKNSRAVIERITNYPHLVNSVAPAMNNSSSFRNDLGIEMLSTQSNNMGAEYIVSMMNQDQDGVAFSTPIYTGMTMASGDKIPLMSVGGLICTLELAPSSSVFTFSGAPGTASPEYELTELFLTGSYYVPSLDERSDLVAEGKSGEIEINTFTPLFSTVQSTAQTQTYSLGLSEVISVLWSFVPARFINSYANNEHQHLYLTQNTDNRSNQLTKVNVLRSGIQLPFNYDLTVEPDTLEAELHKYYLMALKKISDISETAVDAETQDIRFVLGSANNLVTSVNQVKEENKLNKNYGVPYDILSNYSGVNFNGEPLSLELTSTLADGTSNAQFVFVLHKSKIMYSNQGIQVMN